MEKKFKWILQHDRPVELLVEVFVLYLYTVQYDSTWNVTGTNEEMNFKLH